MARYQGNPPQDASRILFGEILEMHAEDAAFLWSIRRKAVRRQKYKLRDLARADERVEAHLEGLDVAGTDGWSKLVDALGDGQAGAVFAGSVWAMRAGDWGRFGAALDSAGDERPRLDAVLSAFGWASAGGTAIAPPPSTAWARRLVADPAPKQRFVGVGAFAVCRVSPSDEEIDAWLGKERDPRTRARAARLVGELGLGNAVAMLEYLLDDEALEVRQGAAWSLCALRSNHQIATRMLMAAAQDLDPDLDALEMAARRLSAEHVQGWMKELIAEGRARAALLVAAACGWPSIIDDLLPLMSEEETAPLAGLAFTQITGADLVVLNLERDDKKVAAEAGGDVDIENEDVDQAPSDEEEEDAHLPFPDPDLVARWWREHRSEIDLATRHLAGRPIHQAGLRQTLVAGSQPQRRAAAVELACLSAGTPIYNTSQPGFSQARGLLGWT